MTAVAEAKTPEPHASATPSAPYRSERGTGTYLALLGYVVLTAIAMWPAISDLSNTVMGSLQPGDATAGGVWLGWQLLVTPPFATHTQYLGAPQGIAFWDVTYLTKLAWVLPQWALSEVVGPVGSWNLALALGFIADGMAMFLLVRWLLGRTWIAFVAGVLYAFSPFHVEESYAHIGYVYSWIFPLILWAGLSVFRKPTWRSGIVFGITVGVAVYVDGYYIVFAPLLGGLLAMSGIGLAGWVGIRRRDLLRAYLAACTSAALVALPLVVTYLFASNAVGQELSYRYESSVNGFSARWWEYVVPWAASPLWGRFVTGWVLDQLRPFTPIETSLYLGSGVLLLAAGFIVSSWRRRRPVLDTMQFPPRFLSWMLFGPACILVLCSFAWIGPIPGLPIFLWHVKPLFRAYSRLDVAVDCLVVVTAAVALSLLAATSRRRWIAPALAVLAIADGTAILPWSSWSFASNTAAAYTWLAAHSDGGIVANYPLLPSPLPAYAKYVTFQVVDHHPLFNGAPQTTVHGRLEHGLADITDPQTIPALRTVGVRYVILDKNLYLAMEWRKVHLKGVRLLVSSGGVLLYRIEPGPRVPAALTIVSGFSQERPFLPHLQRWMSTSSAIMGIDVFQPGIPLRISFYARSFKRPRLLRVFQSGHLMWQGQTRVHTRVVLFATRSHTPLKLVCRPGSASVPGFGDKRSINITNLQVEAAP